MGNEDWTIKAPAKSIIILIYRNQVFFKDLEDIGKFSPVPSPTPTPIPPSSATPRRTFSKKNLISVFPGSKGLLNNHNLDNWAVRGEGGGGGGQPGLDPRLLINI